MNFYNKEELIEILAEHGTLLKKVEGDLRLDEDVVITALNSTMVALQYVDERLSNNKNFILRAMKETPWALYIYKLASKKLRADEEILKEALREDGEVIAYAERRFHNRVDLAYIALHAKKNPGIRYFDNGVKGNKEFMEEVLIQSPGEMRYMADSLRKDIYFLTKVADRNSIFLKFLDNDTAKAVEECLPQHIQEDPARVG